MKTISITVHDRPEYLVKFLETLVRNDLDGWHIVVGLEPSSRKSEQLELIARYIPQAEVIQNEKKLGVRINPLSLLKYVFETLESEVNLYLEEDIIVSPDITTLADWYIELEEDTLCLCYNNIGISYQDLKNSNAAIIYPNPQCTRTGQGNGFSAYGLVVKREKFLEHMEPYWSHKSGWDWGVWYHIQDTGQQVLIPYQTRSDHIGERGVHIGSRAHLRRLGHGGLEVYQGRIAKEDFYLSREFKPCDFDPRERYASDI
jgi:hypothetical protein